jgi:1-acyl-sn-glycerol-3-phosphate acyltransferase
MAPIQAVLLAVGAVAASRRNARWYWRGVAAILGLRLVVRGAPADRRPILFVSNHISWLDIVALGAVLDAAFVAKAEVKGWPVFGWIAQLGRTVYVDRQRRSSHTQRDGLLERLTKAHESLILFPEGTSHDGNMIRAFKSALLSAAAVKDDDGHPLSVQPVTIAYTRLDGMPIGRAWRPFYGWFGDMALAPHLWTMIGLGVTTVEIELHPPTSLEQFTSRKALAEHCARLIGQGLAAANAGRLPSIPAPSV